MKQMTMRLLAAVLFSLIGGGIQMATAQWSKKTLENVGSLCTPSGVVDAAGAIHVTYFMLDGDVRHATNARGGWTVETVAVTGIAAPYGTSSVAVGTDGTLHIAFGYKEDYLSPGILCYTNNRGGTWKKAEKILENPSGCWAVSAGIDTAGHVHICYLASTGMASAGSLMYVNNSSGLWKEDSIGYGADDLSMALDRNGKAHVSYYHGLSRVAYITNAPGSWQEPEIIDTVGGQMEGMVTGIAVDTLCQPHISYVRGSNEDIFYATKGAGTWTKAFIDTGGFQGYGNAIALDTEGSVHISYFHNRSGSFRYATNKSGSWARSVVSGSGGMYNAVVADRGGFAHLCYSGYTEVMYATNAPQPHIVVKPQAFDFGVVNVGQSRADSLLILNTGDTTLSLRGFKISGVDTSSFSCLAAGRNVEAGDSCSVAVYFTPDSLGDKAASLHVYSNDLDSPTLVPLQGSGWEEFKYWAMAYGGTKNDGVGSFCQTADGGFLVTGSTASFGVGQEDAWVFKVDSHGFLQWEKTYGGSRRDEGRSIIENPDRTILVAGYTSSSTPGGIPTFFLLKLDSLGEVIWQKVYCSGGPSDVTSVRAATGGGYFLAGQDSADAIVLKVDQNGTIEWQRRLSNVRWTSSMEATDDGGCVLGMHCYKFTTQETYSGAWFVKLDANGTIDRQKHLPNALPEACFIRQISDGGYVLLAASRSGFNYPVLMRLDRQWNTLWKKQLSGVMNMHFGAMAVETPAGDLLAAFWPDWRIFCFSASGQPKWSTNFVGKTRGLIWLPDSAIAVAGNIDNDAFLSKVDSTGRLPGCDIFRMNLLSDEDFASDLISTNDVALPSAFVVQNASLIRRESAAVRTIRCSAVSLPDGDQDGVSDREEQGRDAMDPSYDGNQDGIPDWQQGNVASFLSINAVYMTLSSPGGTTLRNVRSIANPDPPASPRGESFLCDFIEFEVTGITAGGGATVALRVPDHWTPTKYFKFGPTPDTLKHHWYEFGFDGQTGAEINGNVITLHLVDGLRGDEDLSANGIIKDPGAPAGPDTTTVAVREKEKVPAAFSLSQNFPNPFNPTTVVSYELPEVSKVKLAVYDLLGREVAVLVNEEKMPGMHIVTWNAKGRASGIYFYTLSAGAFRETRCMVLLR